MTHFTKTSFDNISVKAGTKTETKVYNTHTDDLGSSFIVTAGLTLDGQPSSKTGQIIQLLDQYAYGEKRIDEKPSTSSSSANGGSGSNPEPSTTNTSSFSTKKTFTGKELDAETGLYYYGARYYDSRLGRFISQDPTSHEIADIRLFENPQRWNLYSYTLNNPVRYIDPSGQIPDPTDAIALGCGPAAGVCFIVKEAVEGAIIFTVYSIYQGIKEKVKEYKNIEDIPEGMPVINEASFKNESQKSGIGKRFQEMKEIAGGSGAADPGQDPDKKKNENNKNQASKGGEMNTVSKTFSNLGKGYKSMRIELSQRGPHFQLKPNSGGEIYKSFKTIKDFIKQLPKALRNNQDLVNHANKVLEKAKKLNLLN